MRTRSLLVSSSLLSRSSAPAAMKMQALVPSRACSRSRRAQMARSWSSRVMALEGRRTSSTGPRATPRSEGCSAILPRHGSCSRPSPRCRGTWLLAGTTTIQTTAGGRSSQGALTRRHNHSRSSAASPSYAVVALDRRARPFVAWRDGSTCRPTRTPGYRFRTWEERFPRSRSIGAISPSSHGSRAARSAWRAPALRDGRQRWLCMV